MAFKFEVNSLYISIEPSYVLISKKAFHLLTDEDIDSDNIVRGFDRCDGINYYKTYEDKAIVDFISSAIEKYKIKACNLKGELIEATDI